MVVYREEDVGRIGGHLSNHALLFFFVMSFVWPILYFFWAQRYGNENKAWPLIVGFFVILSITGFLNR